MDYTPSEILLNGIKFNLFKDYVDKKALKALPFSDKVKYLEARARLVFLDPLEEMIYLEKSKKISKVPSS
jgi:hypothetical protein